MRKKIIIMIVLLILLIINFGSNIFGEKDTVIGFFYTFETYQYDSEYLVFSKIVQEKYYNQNSPYGLAIVNDKQGNTIKNIWDKIANYDSSEDELEILEYKSQVGLHGHIFSFLYNKLHIPFWVLKLICCTLLGIITLGICYCIYKKYNKLMAVIFYITFLLSPWVVAFARNLYWVEFTWFLPALFGILLSLDCSKWKIYTPCIFIAILVKCLCGYEYITTIMLMTIAFFIIDFFVTKDKTERIKIFKTTFIVGIACLLAFATALFIHASIRGEGNILEGIEKIYKEDVLRRTIMASEDVQFPEEYKKSLEATVSETIDRYFSWHTDIILGINGKYFRLIFGVTLAIIIYNLLTKNKDSYRDLTMFLVFFVTTMSWFVLGKAHSFIHTHMNYVLWYFGYVQISIYIIIKFICEKISKIEKII
ncbi:MAG: hypothetical protein IJE59_02480 [Clostridia bacterium]|nr:hypothetical protein [Clostridia bacterium]